LTHDLKLVSQEDVDVVFYDRRRYVVNYRVLIQIFWCLPEAVAKWQLRSTRQEDSQLKVLNGVGLSKEWYDDPNAAVIVALIERIDDDDI